VLENLAWLLATDPDATNRNGAEAVRLAERACALTERQTPALVGTLAAAYAEAGRFGEAVATAQEACALASKAKDQALLRKNQELLELYRAGQAYHEATRPAPAGGNLSETNRPNRMGNDSAYR
jgi:spermidine synthase